MTDDDLFQFYEIVRVLESAEYPDLIGHYGFIGGKSWRFEDPEPHGPVDSYAVVMFGEGVAYAFAPHQLKASGYLLATQKDDRGHQRPIEADRG